MRERLTRETILPMAAIPSVPRIAYREKDCRQPACGKRRDRRRIPLSRRQGWRVSPLTGPFGARDRTATVRSAVVIKPVSAHSLSKTGIFAEVAGDFRQFPPPPRRAWSPETNVNARKARISGPFSSLLGSLAENKNVWLGCKDSNLDMAISTWDPLACSTGATELHLIGIRKPLETLEF